MVPEDRREQLAGDDRDEVAPPRPVARRATTTTTARATTTASRLERGRGLRRQAQLVGDRAGREVVRRRDRVADRAEERDVVGPGAEADERGSCHEARPRPATAAPTTTARQRRSAAAQPKRIAGWSLIERADRDRWRRGGPGRSSQRQPSSEQEEQERPDLAELDRVDDRPATARPGAARSPSGPTAETGRSADPADRAIATTAPVQTPRPGRRRPGARTGTTASANGGG